MHISSRRRALLSSLALLALAAPSAMAAPRTATVTPESAVATWDGARANGANVSWFTDSLRPSGVCDTTDARSYCDDTLVHFTADELVEGAQLQVRIEDFDSIASDFDLRVYTSNVEGEAVEYLGSPDGDFNSDHPTDGTQLAPVGDAAFPLLGTSLTDFETKVVDLAPTAVENSVAANGYFLVRVVYFAAANSKYEGSATYLAPAAG